MVDHLVATSQLAVLVADRVEAMRAGGDDALEPVPIERLHVTRGEDLPDVVVAHPPSRVAGARLLLAEDREPDPGAVETGREGPGDAPVALVEGGRAADPVEDLDLVQLAGGGELGDGRDLEREPLRPVGPGRLRLAPRVAGPLHVREGSGQLGREARVLEDQVAPQPDDLVDVLDDHRAGLDAGTAGHAVPDRVVRDRGVHDRRRQAGRVGSGVVEVVGVADDRRVRDEVDPVLGVHGHLPDAHDERLGVEWLAGRIGRAGVLAAAALGAGEPVEEVLPAEVLERPHAERRRLVLEVHRRQLAARGELAEVHVEEAGDDVEVLAERQVDDECRHEGDMGPPQGGEPGLRRRGPERSERDGQGVGDERSGHIAVGRGLERLGQQLGRDDAADHRQDQQPRAAQRQPCGPGHEPPEEGVGDRHEDDHRHHVLHRRDERPEDPVERPRDDRLDEPAGDDVGRADRQQDEAPEDREVHQPRPAVLEHPRLDQGVPDQAPRSARNVAERAGALGPDRGKDPQVAGHDQSEDDDRAPEQREHERIAGNRGERLEHVSRLPRRAGRVASRRPRPDRGRTAGQRLEGMIQHRHDRLERLERSARAAGYVDDERPGPDADHAARQDGHRCRPAALRPDQLGQTGDLVVDDGRRRLRGDVARGQPGPAGRHDQRVVRRAVDQRLLDLPALVGHDAPLDREPQRGQALGEPVAGGIVALRCRDTVADGEDQRPAAVAWARAGVAHAPPFFRPRIRPAVRSPGRAFGADAGPAVARSAGRIHSPLLPPVFETSRTDRISTPRSTPLTIS